MDKVLVLAAFGCLHVLAGRLTAGDPPSLPVPSVLAWATFDVAEIKLIDTHKTARQLVVTSGAELLAAVRPNEKADVSAVAAAEGQLANVLKVPQVNWEKHCVVLRVGGYTRVGGEFRLDLRPRAKDAVTAQWTFKENGKYQIWSPAAAALVERTKAEVNWDQFRYIDRQLNVRHPD